VLEGMAEYYSLNLAREVMKGLSETAYQCKHTGGTPPLGYDLAADKTYELNHFEAEAVQIIFTMYLEGHGYGAIIDRLNERGHKTKLGRAFGKNSIHDILKNEKYSGVFVFNKTQRKVEGKRNGHLQKPDEEIIRVPGGCPAIVTPEMFERVKRKMEENKHRTGQYKSKRVYILSGLVLCGKCGSAMVGKHARSGRNKTDYSYYECNSRRNKRTCDAKPISKPFVEDLVIDFLYENLFSDDAIGPASDKIYEDIQKYSQQVPDEVKQFQEQLQEVDAKVESMIQSVMDGMYHPSMKIKMKELEEKQIALQRRLDEAAKVDRNLSFTRDQIYHFLSLYQDIKNFSDLKKKSAVNLFVDHVIVNEDDVHLSVVTRPDAKGPLKKAKTTGGISGSSWDLLVETRGVEPLSESPLPSVSPSAATVLDLVLPGCQ